MKKEAGEYYAVMLKNTKDGGAFFAAFVGACEGRFVTGKGSIGQ